MKAAFILLALCAAVLAQEDFECPDVNPIRTFKYPEFQGRWFEIGHYRNAGSAVWNEECYCSYSNVTEDPLGIDEGDSVYNYVCNLEDENGDIQLFETNLYNMRPPGKFQQDVIPIFEAQTMTVIEMTQDYALVYRCGYYIEAISYSAQILSRKNTLDDATVEKLKAKVTELKLNPENAEYVMIPHGNCTYTDF